MIQTRVGIASLLLALSLSACDELEGVVEGKAYRPPYDTNETRPRYQTVCMPRTSVQTVNGRTTTRTYTDCHQVYVGQESYIDHHPECYEVTVKQDEDGKLKTKCLPKSIYDSLDSGEHYSEKGDG